MPGQAREVLLGIADRLCAELGYTEAGTEVEEKPAPPTGLDGNGMGGLLSAEDESLVVAMRRSLVAVATEVGTASPPKNTERAVDAALDGAELVMRGELAVGNGAHLPALFPSFVFLVTLPLVEQDEALELSERTAELVERAMEG